MKLKQSKKAMNTIGVMIGILVLLIVAAILIAWQMDAFGSGKKSTNDLFFCEAQGNTLRPGNTEPGVCMAAENPCPDGMTPLQQGVVGGSCDKYYTDKPVCCLPELG